MNAINKEGRRFCVLYLFFSFVFFILAAHSNVLLAYDVKGFGTKMHTKGRGGNP